MDSDDNNEWGENETSPSAALTIVEPSAAAALNRSEVMVQLDAAHRYARSIKRFMNQSIGMATISVPTAESCMYAVPRGQKTISGPSVRLAEIMASAYGNLHIGARIVEIGDKDITAQGVAWDLETNLRVTVEQKRRITNKDGKRFNEDMINVTCAAACSIALRNAIFRVVPRAYVDQVYDRCRKVAIGDAQTLVARRDEVLARLVKFGATQDRVLAALKLQGIQDINLDHLETLIGWGTALKQGDRTVDEVFPAPAVEVPGTAQPGRKVSLRKAAVDEKRDAKAEREPEPAKSPPVAESAAPPVETAKRVTLSDGSVMDPATGEIVDRPDEVQGREPGSDD